MAYIRELCHVRTHSSNPHYSTSIDIVYVGKLINRYRCLCAARFLREEEGNLLCRNARVLYVGSYIVHANVAVIVTHCAWWSAGNYGLVSVHGGSGTEASCQFTSV